MMDTLIKIHALLTETGAPLTLGQISAATDIPERSVLLAIISPGNNLVTFAGCGQELRFIAARKTGAALGQAGV